VTDAPRGLADLKPGVRLRDAATATVWTIECVVRANSYATPWVHLVLGETDGRRVEGAGTLLDPATGWSYASEA
jgi:hypothetical protein